MIRVDLFADFVCPWSYLGLARLDRLSRGRALDLAWHWRPFRLHPTGVRAHDGRLVQLESPLHNLAPLISLAREEDITFPSGGPKSIPDTLMAHRALAVTPPGPAVAGIALDLYATIFNSRADVSEPGILRRIWKRHGADLDTALAGSRTGQLERIEAEASHLGIASVPSFLFNRSYLMVGAEDSAAFEVLLDAALAA